jgi:hypothetical protein
LIWKDEVIFDFSEKSFSQRRMPDVVRTGNGCDHKKWKNKMHVVDQQIVWKLKNTNIIINTVEAI